jgi:hypothetical protein
VIKLPEHKVVLEFGSSEAFSTRVERFKQAVVDHTTTEGIPAPTEHPLVEFVVKQHNSLFEFEGEPEPPATPKLTLDQRKSALLEALAAFRWQWQNLGVPLKGYVIPSDAATLNQFVAALIMKEPVSWKVSDREFVAFSKPEVKNAIRAIRAHIQQAFNIEKHVMAKIVAARSHKALDEINVAEAFTNGAA